MNKRKDECQFCKSRSCYHRIVRKIPPLYDEVFCSKHVKEGYDECDSILGKGNGIMRSHISSTGKLKRD